MQYSDIIGQAEAKERLMKMVAEARVPHALLFSGEDGCGHLPMALAFAQHLFCQNKKSYGACTECASCKKVSHLAHPDLHFAFPVIKSKNVGNSDALLSEFREALLEDPYLGAEKWAGMMDAGNKQPIIPVEEAGSILRKLSYTSYEGAYKMMIIWQPERMNAESANKLLKILEEPPDQTLFILVSSQPDQLLATILSRVQRIPFFRCSEEEIVSALKSKFHVNEEVARQAAVLADGNYMEAVAALSESDESTSILVQFQGFMRLALKLEVARALEWIDSAAAGGRERQKQFLAYGLQVFRDSLMLNAGAGTLVRLSGQERQFLEKFAPFIQRKNAEALSEEFNTAYYHIERNAHAKILFMDLLLRTRDLLLRK